MTAGDAVAIVAIAIVAVGGVKLCLGLRRRARAPPPVRALARALNIAAATALSGAAAWLLWTA